MSLRKNCPCDIDGVCPYEAKYISSCEYWCGQEEPEDEPDIWDPEEEEAFIQLYDGGFEDE